MENKLWLFISMSWPYEYLKFKKHTQLYFGSFSHDRQEPSVTPMAISYAFIVHHGTDIWKLWFCPEICSRPTNARKSRGDLVLIQTSQLFCHKCKLVGWKQLDNNTQHKYCSEVCNKTMSPPASLPFKGQFAEQTTLKLSTVGFKWAWLRIIMMYPGSITDPIIWCSTSERGLCKVMFFQFLVDLRVNKIWKIF